MAASPMEISPRITPTSTPRCVYFFPPPKKLLSMSPMASAGSFEPAPVFLPPFFPTSSSATSLSAASNTFQKATKWGRGKHAEITNHVYILGHKMLRAIPSRLAINHVQDRPRDSGALGFYVAVLRLGLNDFGEITAKIIRFWCE